MATNFASKNYTNKIPTKVRAAMKEFTKSECYLVKKKKVDIGSNGKHGNCHINVKEAVEKYGGRMVNGWLLYRKSKFINDGFYAWSFHSIWETKDKEWLDVTEDATYIGSDYTTFWEDANRVVDLVEGVNYNNIMVLEDRSYADLYGETIRENLNLGEVYWTNNNYQHVKKLNEHSGKYRWITGGYENNIKKLEEEYGIKIKDGKIVVDDPNKEVSINVFFDYSLNMGGNR